MTNLQKARMNLYEAMESCKMEQILDASRKLDKLIVRQMYRRYGKKRADVA
ncbi:MAG: Spo0E family sporulation regulatory protein-aspartic acid phosphatase [Thermoclostridium sp.]|nr:Spo0E family sporulation regulatory protein-aspartic acid phosphatase [Thermoclostridium sp.]